MFFDPPLGPPWPKHPCTIREPELAIGGGLGDIAGDGAYDAVQNNASYAFEIFPRPTSTVVTIDVDGEAATYATDLKLGQQYLDRVWPIKNERQKIVGFSFLTANFEPVEVAARSRRAVGVMDARVRRELSQAASDKLEATVSRISGMDGGLSLSESKYGTFGAVETSWSNLILVPVPVDHRTAFLYEETEATLYYMAGAADAALEKVHLTTSVPRDGLYVDQIIFVFEDILGGVRDFVTHDLGFEREGHFDTSSRSWSSNPLAQVHARMMWRDALDEGVIELPECALTVEEALEAEAAFCSKVWPEDVAGRWAKVRSMVEALGYTEPFLQIDAALRDIGWRINHKGESYQLFKHEIEYVPPEADPDEYDTPRVRLLLSKSSKDDGAAMAAGRFSETSFLKDVFYRASDKDTLKRLVGKLRQMT